MIAYLWIRILIEPKSWIRIQIQRIWIHNNDHVLTHKKAASKQNLLTTIVVNLEEWFTGTPDPATIFTGSSSDPCCFKFKHIWKLIKYLIVGQKEGLTNWYHFQRTLKGCANIKITFRKKNRIRIFFLNVMYSVFYCVLCMMNNFMSRCWIGGTVTRSAASGSNFCN